MHVQELVHASWAHDSMSELFVFVSVRPPTGGVVIPRGVGLACMRTLRCTYL